MDAFSLIVLLVWAPAWIACVFLANRFDKRMGGGLELTKAVVALAVAPTLILFFAGLASPDHRYSMASKCAFVSCVAWAFVYWLVQLVYEFWCLIADAMRKIKYHRKD